MIRVISQFLIITCVCIEALACDNSPISIEIIDSGLYQIEGSDDFKYKGLPGEQLHIQGEVKLIEKTEVIPAVIGNKLGFRYKIMGKDIGKNIELTIAMYYPEAGISDPNTGKVHRIDRYTIPAKIGDTNTTYYSLDAAWELVPGEWRREVWYGCNMLGGKTFKVVKAGAKEN